MSGPSSIAVVILNYNSATHTRRCLEALCARTADPTTLSVVVVDNASAPEDRKQLESLRTLGAELVMSERNLGFSGGMMLGVSHLPADYYMLLNSDCEFRNDVLAMLTGFMDSHPDAALCTGSMLDADGKSRSSFNYFPSLFHAVFG